MIKAFPVFPHTMAPPPYHHSEQLDRIEQRLVSLEAMLATLLDMLAQDDEPQAFDLSGQSIPRERGDNEPL